MTQVTSCTLQNAGVLLPLKHVGNKSAPGKEEHRLNREDVDPVPVRPIPLLIRDYYVILTMLAIVQSTFSLARGQSPSSARECGWHGNSTGGASPMAFPLAGAIHTRHVCIIAVRHDVPSFASAPLNHAGANPGP